MKFCIYCFDSGKCSRCGRGMVAMLATVFLLMTGCGPGVPPVKGLNSLITLSESAPGCPQGGITVSSGLDANDNGVLDLNEITSSEEVCNGQDGEDGEDGEDGASYYCKPKKHHGKKKYTCVRRHSHRD